MANSKFHTTFKPSNIVQRKGDKQWIVWEWLPIEDYYDWHITFSSSYREECVNYLRPHNRK